MKKPEKPPNQLLLDKKQREALLKLFEDETQKDKLYKIEKDYPYWDKFKYKTKKFETAPELLWKFIKIQRERNITRINLSNVSGFEFKYNTTARTLQQLHEFDMFLGGSLETNPILQDKNKERYLIGSVMEEAITSSQLEGAVTTRKVAKEMLRTKRKPKNISEKMIYNNYQAMLEIVKQRNKTLTPTLIKNLHKIIIKGTLDNASFEGKYRTNDDVSVVDGITGEVFYQPPSHKHLDQLIKSVCAFANAKNEREFIHPIIRAIILHFLIGYIHPFVDGNGRTARAVFYWYLVSHGYWLVEYISLSRIILQSPAQYARAYLYTEYDENDLTYFIDFNLKSLSQALKSLEEYLERKKEERRQLFKLIKVESLNERHAEIIKELMTEPEKLITINEIQSKFGIVYQTARTDLLNLSKQGYLDYKQSGKKLVFYRSDNFDQKIRELKNAA